MRAWPFTQSKTPGFGISRGYYLTILSSASVLPCIAQIANPNGAEGAVPGLGVPLGTDRDKTVLTEAMRMGQYAIASNDRKTVLKMGIMSKEEAGFDPEIYVQSILAKGEDPEIIARLRGTWTISQLVYESHDPGVYPALDFFLGVSRRMAMLSEGVVADSICQRYLLPENVVQSARMDPKVDVREHVVINLTQRESGIHVYTLGMQKFALPEFEILNLTDGGKDWAVNLLLSTAQQVLMSKVTRIGDLFGSTRAAFKAAEGGFLQEHWHGTPVIELQPPISMTPTEALEFWAEDVCR